MINEEEYAKWLKHATKKQITFVNSYLKNLDAYKAFQDAGYNFSNKGFGKWKIFNKLLPIIQYKLSQYDLSVGKELIISNWLSLLNSSDNAVKITALKELSKLFGYTDDVAKINVENNIPQTPVVIQFSDK